MRQEKPQGSMHRYPGCKLARLACIAAMLLLGGCTQAPRQVMAQEPAADTASALDGMVLREYPGPKAQIQYAEGKPDFYSNLMEMFTVVLIPQQKRPIAGLFVQDMGKTDWDHPHGHWIVAKTALYVVGSKKLGSMGPAFVSFSNPRDAADFVKREGGKIFAFDQISLEMVN